MKRAWGITVLSVLLLALSLSSGSSASAPGI